MKPFDYNNFKDYKLYNLLRPLANVFVKLMFNVQIIGKEHIPEEDNFILACNHISAFDPILLYYAVKRPLHYMGKAELFNNALGNYFITRLNAFPVKRGKHDTSAIDYAINLLKNGKILGIFPEGRRSKDTTPLEARSGIAVIAKAAQANVLPVAIYAVKKPRFRTKVTIRFGELIEYETLTFAEKEKEDYKKVAANVMNQIKDLWGAKHEN